MSNTMIVRIVGEPFLGRAMKYREEYAACCETWNRFRESVGATECRANGAFKFPGEPEVRRSEWRHSKYSPGRDWWCARKDTALLLEIMKLPPMPETRPIFGDAIIEDYHYEVDGENWGGGAVASGLFGPKIGWAGDVFVCVIPDPLAAVKEECEAHPNAVFRGDIEGWTLAEGLVQITKAESDLIFAQAAVDAERREQEKNK